MATAGTIDICLPLAAARRRPDPISVMPALSPAYFSDPGSPGRVALILSWIALLGSLMLNLQTCTQGRGSELRLRKPPNPGLGFLGWIINSAARQQQLK